MKKHDRINNKLKNDHTNNLHMWELISLALFLDLTLKKS